MTTVAVLGGLLAVLAAFGLWLYARGRSAGADRQRIDQSEETARVQTEMAQAVANAPASVDALAQRVRQHHDL